MPLGLEQLRANTGIYFPNPFLRTSVSLGAPGWAGTCGAGAAPCQSLGGHGWRWGTRHGWLLLPGPCSRAVSVPQQWLVSGERTADLWQNCSSGNSFHCQASSTNGECLQDEGCAPRIRALPSGSGVLLPTAFVLLPAPMESRGIFPCGLFGIPSWIFLRPLHALACSAMSLTGGARLCCVLL